MLISVPFSAYLCEDAGGILNGFKTNREWFSANSPKDARILARFINNDTEREDIVLVSDHIAWLINARTAQLSHAAAIKGNQYSSFGVIDKDRFLFNCSYKNARFVITDKFTYSYHIYQEGIYEILNEVYKWPIVYQIGEYKVYKNPEIE